MHQPSLPLFLAGQYYEHVSFSETVFLFILALVIFGPKKLPEIARQAGKILNEFRRASNEFKSQIEQEIAHIEVAEQRKTMLPLSMAPEGTASRKPVTTRGELTTLEAPATLAAAPDLPAADIKLSEIATEAVPPISAEMSAAPSTPTGLAEAQSNPKSQAETEQESHA